MAKQRYLNTTVHFTDPETGRSETWHPQRKLSAADIERLGWPEDHESIVEGDEPEEISQADHLRAGHPMAERTGPADAPSAVDEESIAIRQAAKELESINEGDPNRAGLNTSAKRSFPVDEVVEQAQKSSGRKSS